MVARVKYSVGQAGWGSFTRGLNRPDWQRPLLRHAGDGPLRPVLSVHLVINYSLGEEVWYLGNLH